MAGVGQTYGCEGVRAQPAGKYNGGQVMSSIPERSATTLPCNLFYTWLIAGLLLLVHTVTMAIILLYNVHKVR